MIVNGNKKKITRPSYDLKISHVDKQEVTKIIE